MADDPVVSVEFNSPRLEREIDGFAADLEKEKTAALRSLGSEMEAALKRAVRQSPPSSGTNARTKPHRSREQAAQGITAEIVGGKLRVSSDDSHMASPHHGFPLFYGMSQIRHPVYGHRPVVSQRGHGRWFTDTTKPFTTDGGKAEHDLTAATQRSLDRIKGDR